MDKNFSEWSPREVAQYLTKKEKLEDYTEVFEKNKIDGTIAFRLTDAELKDMGIGAIGDRHRILSAFETMGKAKSQKDREKILWEGTEVLYWTCCDKGFKTCCGICSDDHETYILRNNFLEINRPDYNKCGAIRCCYGHKYEIDTVDLSNIAGVQVEGIPPPCIQQCCCCAKAQEHIRINLHTPEKGFEILKLKKGVGENVSRKIKNQVEVMQVMERS